MKYGDLSADQTEALIDKVGGIDGLKKLLADEWVVGEPANFLKNGARGTSGEVVADLLEVVGQPVELPAAERFVARDKFVVDSAGELPLTYVGEDFTEKFLGVVEEGVTTARIQPYKLVKATIDGPIFSALGGEGGAKIALAHLFEFLKTADRSSWYFFYVVDAAGSLWAVDTYWRDGGWDLESYSVTYPRGWRGGGHVVSGGLIG